MIGALCVNKHNFLAYQSLIKPLNGTQLYPSQRQLRLVERSDLGWNTYGHALNSLAYKGLISKKYLHIL
jgi:hypothetical protein